MHETTSTDTFFIAKAAQRLAPLWCYVPVFTRTRRLDAPSFAREKLMRLGSSAQCTGRATLARMPLHVRLRKDHHPHDARSPRLDDHVVLSGGLEVGGFQRSRSGPSEGRWSWTHAIGTDDTTFAAGGYATYPEVCRTLITLAFRRTLARADLRERPDAKPGPPNRAPPDVIAEPSPPMPAYDRETAQWLGMVRSERRIFVRSGELIVGVLDRTTHGPDSWSWFLTGPCVARLSTPTISSPERTKTRPSLRTIPSH